MGRGHLPTVAVALLAALALGACGGSSNSASSAPARTVTVVRTQPVQSATTTTGSGAPRTKTRTRTRTSTTGGSTSGVPACVAADLTPRFVNGNGAAGTDILTFALTNTSGASCHTYGWPGVQFLGSDGSPVEPPSSRTTTDPAIQHPIEPTEIALKPGQAAPFQIIIDEGYNGGAGCKEASYLQIYAPDDTVAMKLAVRAWPCPKSSVTPLQ